MLRLAFDRGTLVLSGLRPDCSESLKPALPPVFVWDPRVDRYRAPAYRYREAALWMAVRDGAVNEVFARRVRTNLWTAPDLRAYQRAALLAWQVARRYGIVVLPTGAGKTRVACAAMAAARCASLCLVPTRALLHQWREEIARHYRGDVGCLGDGERRIEHVTVATFEGAYRNMARLGSRFGLIVVDEAHHFGTGVRDEALQMSAAPLRLGLTATAPESEAMGDLTELLGPIVYSLSVADLSGEWLAEFNTEVVLLRFSAEEQRQYELAVARFRAVYDPFRSLSPNGTWSDFVRAASRSEPGMAALSAFRFSRRLTAYPSAKRVAVGEILSRHRMNRVLIFTSDNDTAYAIAREHLVMPITCDIERAERDQALAAFRAGELRVLVSARVLNEGIDVPDADVAIIVGGRSGQREHVQRVGRLLRPSPGKHALVYELVMVGTHEVRTAAERRRGLDAAASR